MKKIFAYLSMAAIATLFAASCQKNETVGETPVKGEKVTLKCVIADTPDSKVSIDAQGKTQWEVGDQILIHGEGSSNRVTVTLTSDDISSDGKVATISFEGVSPYDRSDKGYTSTYYASYPAGNVSSGNLYYYSRFNKTNDKLMAAYNVGDELVFYNLTGVISFSVEGEFDSYEFCGNDKETVGYETYQSRLAATAEDPVLQFNYPSDGGTSGPLTSVSGSVEPDGTTLHYICIPNGVNLTNGFTIKFYDGTELVKVAKSVKGVNLTRGSYLPLGDITSHLKDYVPPTGSDHESAIPLDEATDLTKAAGSSNCYLIYKAGTYKFPALKGNSDEEAGNVFDAAILWETKNDASEVSVNEIIAQLDFENNWLVFKTPDTLVPGNALIAAKDDNGKIIWSWHIWIPETTIEEDEYGISDAPMMDRNLGALTAPVYGENVVTSVGLIYQWGRKDPFPGPKALDSSSQATVAGTKTSVVHDEVTPPGSVNLAIANPTTLYNANSNDWSSAADDNLWNNGGAKSMYDPCPAGYKVPAMADCPGLFISDLRTATGWEIDTENAVFKIGNPATAFIVSGYVDDYDESFSVDKNGSRVAIWNADSGKIIDLRIDKDKYAGQGSTSKSRGAYVRCIAE